MNEKQTDKPNGQISSSRRPRKKQVIDNNVSYSNKRKIKTSNKKVKVLKTSNKSFYITLALTTIIAMSGLSYISYSYFSNHKSNNLSTIKQGDISVAQIQESINNTNKNVENISFQSYIFQEWNDKDKSSLVNIIKNNDLNPSIRNSALNVSLDSLYAYNKDNISILNPEQINEARYGYNKKTIGLSLSPSKVVSDIIPYSSAWRNGIKIGDRILKINGYDVAGYTSTQIEAMLSDPKVQVSTWRFGSMGDFNVSPFKQTVPYGDIAEVNMSNDVLLIRINKITSLTSQVVYELLQKQLYNNNNVNGLIIDLNNTKDHYYNGVDTISWLLNGQKNIPVVKLTDNKDKDSYIYSQPPSFSTDPAVLSKLNTLPKIVLVNSATSGSAEVLAHTITSSFLGTPTDNYSFKNTYYSISDNHMVALKDKIVTLPDGQSIRVIPKSNKQLIWPMFLYNKMRYR